MNKTKWFCMLTIGMLTAGFAQTKKDSVKVETLGEVVLSDTRFKIKRENSGKTVVKITRDEIERNQGKTVAELINTKSGIEINGSRSVAGQNLGYFIRGGNNRQVLVLIDGIQVNDPSLVSNEFDLRLLDLNTIDSIEILKGASSTLYGNSASTAVINITTRKAAEEEFSASILSVFGTNQTQDNLNYNVSSFTNNISLNGTLHKFSYVASFGNQYMDGLSAAKSDNPEIDPFSRYNTGIKLGYEFSDKFSLSAFTSIDKFKTDIDGFPPPNFTLADTDDTFTSEQFRFGLAPKFEYKNGSFQVNASFTKINRETISAFSTVNDAESIIVDAFNKYVINDKFYTIIGINYGDYNSIFAEEESFSNSDPYANVVYVSDYGLNLNIGGRLNNHSEYGSQFVYNINPSYNFDLNKGYTKVFGSYATSFIAPNLSQLFGFFGANPDLEPEENKTIEGGLEYNSKDGIRLSGVYFNRNEKSTIIFTSEYENSEEDATVQGFEVEAELDLIENLQLTANYTFTELIDGERIRLPKHRANAYLGYDFSNETYASINLQYVGERSDLDFSTFSNTELDAYALFNLYFSHKILDDKMKLFITLDNILNEDYFEILGYTTRGRNVSVGFNLNL
ncbi:TonB-dependent receptor plug domain-containing protein [Winogradskyella vincentii]|uniref:TonB-dependent receptor n=1 Tax=Winogradskyella vincentii TaxID=2877122 RepID=A0ABS7Y2B8_9FLAO|nr:TonB-dependent receptor [Winogradskyella vincentii]MCA0153405.1 TonB-dependent receptor [Winogradskyella vincentii]